MCGSGCGNGRVRMDDRLKKKVLEVSDFLMELSRKHSENGGKPIPPPYADFAYAEALVKWEDNGKDPMAMFSTEWDDPFFLEFKKEISEHFGLEVLSQAEAADRKKYYKFFTQKVSEEWLLN